MQPMTALELREVREALRSRLELLDMIKATCEHCQHFAPPRTCNKFAAEPPPEFCNQEGACPDWSYDGVPF